MNTSIIFSSFHYYIYVDIFFWKVNFCKFETQESFYEFSKTLETANNLKCIQNKKHVNNQTPLPKLMKIGYNKK